MWKLRRSPIPWTNIRRLSTERWRRVEDEGDWLYSSEWWGSDSSHADPDADVVLRSTSDHGNGVVSVLSYPSSRPSEAFWPETEQWLQHRYAEIHPGPDHEGRFRVLGYHWRVLRFNEDTRQSTVKILAASRVSEPDSVCIMQQPHCLAIPYVKSMVSAGLATIASCNYDFTSVVHGKKAMHILCIGHGGGSLPLFLASKIQGAIVHIVEIDPLVISTSIRAMGFPSFSVVTPTGERVSSKPDAMDEVLWKGIHERIFLYEADAEKFIASTNHLYDMVFIDAYDGDDIFPHKLWDPDSTFLKSLNNCLHPDHGTVVVNLHSDYITSSAAGSIPSDLLHVLPSGKYVSSVCRAYKDVLLSSRKSCGRKRGSGLSFTVHVPWVCNSSLVVCRGLGMGGDRDMVMDALISKSREMENILKLPFSCTEYLERGFVLM